MTEEIKCKMQDAVRDFHLPRYQNLPDVDLYLEQVVRYVNQNLALKEGNELTSSMVSNYVKQKIIPGPNKKTYGRETLGYLIFIVYMKMILPMEDIRKMIAIQEETYEFSVAYEYFCEEFENLLQTVFGLKEKPDPVGNTDTNQKELLHSAILSIVHKIYLQEYFKFLKEE